MSETIERPANAQTPAAPPPARQDSRPLRQVEKVAELFTNAEFITRIEKVTQDSIKTNLMLSALAGSLRRSPGLQDCSVMDVAGKALLLAQAGLPPDTVTGLSHLIPFKERDKTICQMVIGYHGLLDLCYRSGKVQHVAARVAWADEYQRRDFEFQLGTDEWLRHIPGAALHNISPQAQADGTAEYPTHAYAIAHLTGSARPFEVWPFSKVIAIRDGTPAYSFARRMLNESRQNSSRLPPAYLKAPWVAFLERMAQKTMLRQLCGTLPRSIELATMVALDEASERRPLDLGPIIDIDSSQYAEAAADAAEMSGDPGAAFGYRSENPAPDAGQEPAQPRQQRAPRQTAAKPPPAAAAPQPPPQPTPQSTTADPPPLSSTETEAVERAPAAEHPDAALRPATPFEEYLLDENGEPVGDTPYGSPGAFARALETAWSTSNNKASLLEQNIDAMQIAAAADERARNIIQSMTDPPFTVRLKEGRDGPIWIEFIREYKAMASTVGTRDFRAFYDTNAPTMHKAPLSTYALLAKAIIERCRVLKIEPPPDLNERLQAATAPPPQPAAPDKDRNVADNIIAEIAKITEAHALEIYSTTAAVKVPRARWMQEGKKDLHDEITNAFVSRMRVIQENGAAT